MIIVMSMIILIVFFFFSMSILEQFDICSMMLPISNLGYMLYNYHDKLSIDKLSNHVVKKLWLSDCLSEMTDSITVLNVGRS
ncbi:hypothetical protein EDC96DRAFT_537910 [Choanephora cucurbitarum]|nr:hypothetical protein EDC96DRAFT_537910 [Choanephora cucurbitarum]